MAKPRMINTRFWGDGFVGKLRPIDRYLFLYFLTNEHTNICGIYELPLRTMMFESKLTRIIIVKSLEALKGKVYYVDGWVYIVNFQKHQNTLSKQVRIGIQVEMAKVPKDIKDKIDHLDTLSGHIIYLNLDLNLNSNLNLVATPSVASQEIVEVINSMKIVNPSYQRMFGNKTERAAAERLIEQYGKENLLNLTSMLEEIVKMPYAPRITTVYQLEKKMGELKAFMAQEKNKVASKSKFVFL